MAKLFGTDGARGVANTGLTCQTAFRLGQAAVDILGNTLVVGRDTRISGDMLFCSLAAGVMSRGGIVYDAGIIPTPGVAFLCRELHAAGGVVISASHNPPEYNGIKFFDGQGFKLDEATEERFEAAVERAEQHAVAGVEAQADGGVQAAVDQVEALTCETAKMPTGGEVGVVVPVEDACRRYVDHAVRIVREAGLSFDGLVVALDAGHGAASLTSREALEQLGATVHVINEDFTGTDINVECGSTYLEPLKRLVAEVCADVGMAHDGDADRVMFVDELGQEIDGDVVEAVCAVDLKAQGLLPGNTVVSTVMCNLGFTKAMERSGIAVEQTQVGDKYVLARMREGGFALGGEQSGHMIFLEHNSTGDGLVTACMFLSAVLRKGGTVSEAASVMRRFPQQLINVRVTDKHAVAGNGAVAAQIAREDAELAGSGRILVRPSGTEPLVRVMVEAPTDEQAYDVARRIADVVERELGA